MVWSKFFWANQSANTSFSKLFSVDTYMKETIETLRLFERDCMTTFINDEAKNKEDTLERRLNRLEEK